MANDPDARSPSEPPELADTAARANRRVANTQGGDYAEGEIDNRQGTRIGRDQYNLGGDFRNAHVTVAPVTFAHPRETPLAFQSPYQPIPLVGRDEALTELAALLTGDAPVAVSPAVGMGGIGKTLLAVTFAHRHQAAFPGGIFWLNMEQPDVVESQVAAWASFGGLDLPDVAALLFEDRIARVRAAWNSLVRRLLVLDNLEAPALFSRWQPTGSGTRVLNTTRRHDWPRHVQRLRLPVLARPSNVELLLGAWLDDQGVALAAMLAEDSERCAADALYEPLGDLPLALAVAVALLRLTPSLRLHAFHTGSSEIAVITINLPQRSTASCVARVFFTAIPNAHA